MSSNISSGCRSLCACYIIIMINSYFVPGAKKPSFLFLQGVYYQVRKCIIANYFMCINAKIIGTGLYVIKSPKNREDV